jgi:hypothetical protein
MAKRHDSKLASGQSATGLLARPPRFSTRQIGIALDTIGFSVHGAAPHAFAHDDQRDYDNVDSRLQ